MRSRHGTRGTFARPKQPLPADQAGRRSFRRAVRPRRARVIRVRALAQGVQQ
ncbi:hypothetical protein C7S13_1899 [Burkholderia cepacia]|nr:hypothetical protein [Burkholderia cepacia]